MKKIFLLICILGLVLTTGCKTAEILTGDRELDRDWELVIDSAKESTVRVYLTREDVKLRTWLNDYFASRMMDKYEINLEIKVVDFEDLYTILENERNKAVSPGVVDMVILRDDEFGRLNQEGYLYEGIASRVPNNNDWLNHNDQEIRAAQGASLDDYGLPLGRDQLVLLFDEDVLEIHPRTSEEMLKFLMANPKTFTYADPTRDATGAAFIQSVIYEMVGPDLMMNLFEEGISQEAVEQVIMPGLDYLKDLDAYVRKIDGAYPSRQSDVDDLFQMGDVYFSMTKDFAYVDTGIDEEIYPYGAMSFIYDEGSIGGAYYMAIPTNGFNKSGGLLVINELMSYEVQMQKYLPQNYGSLPVYDLNLVPPATLEAFQEASIKRGTLTVEALLGSRYVDLPVRVQDMINNLWVIHVRDMQEVSPGM